MLSVRSRGREASQRGANINLGTTSDEFGESDIINALNGSWRSKTGIPWMYARGVFSSFEHPYHTFVCDVCGCLCLCVAVLSVAVCGCLRLSVAVCGCLWLSVAVCCCLWLSVAVCCFCLWLSALACSCLWLCVIDCLWL